MDESIVQRAAKDYLKYAFAPERRGRPPNEIEIRRILNEICWVEYWLNDAPEYASFNLEEILACARELYTVQAILDLQAELAELERPGKIARKVAARLVAGLQ